VDWEALEVKRQRDLRKLQQMQIYAYTKECRRGFVLKYFGDVAAMTHCGACDNCLQEQDGLAARHGIELTPVAEGPPAAKPRRERQERGRLPLDFRRDRRAVRKQGYDLSTDGEITVRSGPDRLRDALRAMRKELAKKHDLPAFMVFSDAVMGSIAEAEPSSAEALLAVPGVGPKLLERFGAPMLELLTAHAEGATLPAEAAPSRNGGSRSGARSVDVVDDAPPTPEQAELFRRLKQLRNELAREANLPAYCIFADKTLVALAKAHPTDEGDMLRVSGVGPAKLEKYGEAFLRVLRDDA
jgi:ATP-dependent DNA helicase RecQ